MALASDAAARAAPGSETAGPQEGAAGGAPQAPEELIEAQLRSILEATGTSAGAVCLFDQHQELLRLAVEIGLSDEGCRRLRSVRRGAATTWDMPLHSLLNRRVYLIESAAKNRYVPPLVEDVAAVRAVACVPLFDGSTPVGSLILVALAPRGFGERQVRSLEQPARQLVTHIVAMRKRVATAGPARVRRPGLAASTPAPAATLQTAGPLVAGPTSPRLAPIPVAGDDAAQTGGIQGAVDRARVELERLRTRVAEGEETALSERARATAEATRRTELEADLATARAERDGLARALAEQAGEISASAERLRTLDAALDDARATEAALRAEVQGAHETNAGHAAAADSEQAAALETARARIAELEALHSTLEQRIDDAESSGRAAMAAANTRADTVAADAETRIAAAEREADERVRAADAAADALRARIAEIEGAARGALAQAEADAASERGEAAAVRARLDALETEVAGASAGGDARAAAMIAELEGRHAAVLDEWRRRCEAAEAQRETPRPDARGGADPPTALSEERARWDEELAVVREREAALEQRLAALQAELATARSEDDQLRHGFAHLESLIQTTVDADPAARATPGDASAFEIVELDATGGGDDGTLGPLDVGTLDIEELGDSGAPAAAAPAPAPTPEPVAAPAGVVVLDTEGFWTSLPAGESGLSLLPPGPDVASEIATRNPERLLLNLGAPGVLASLAALREAGVAAPAFACIVVAGQPRGIVVGRIELATRPIDPDALLGLLQGTFARGIKVVTAGADVDGLISLRQALARIGVSVSMAWDAKQASDLLTMVRPEVAIVDLELPPKDGCALVARMGLTTPPPFTVVVPKSTDTAGAFTTALAHPELSRATLPAKELLARLLALPARLAAPVRK